MERVEIFISDSNPGDRSFEDLVRQCWREALRIARRYLDSSEEAEDVANDAFLVLWKRLQRESLSNPMGYLAATIQNLCLRDNGQRKALGERVSEDVLEFVQAPEERAEGGDGEEYQPNIRGEFENLIEAEILKLSPAERTAAWLFFVEKKSPREIEEELNISSTARRQRHHRAVKKLKSAALLYRAQKILVAETRLRQEIAISWLIKGKRLTVIAAELGLTYLELGQAIRGEDFECKLVELKRLRSIITPPKELQVNEKARGDQPSVCRN